MLKAILISACCIDVFYIGSVTAGRPTYVYSLELFRGRKHHDVDILYNEFTKMNFLNMLSFTVKVPIQTIQKTKQISFIFLNRYTYCETSSKHWCT